MGFMNIGKEFAINYAHNKMQKALYNGLNIDMLDKPLQKTPKENINYMLYMHVPFCHTFCPYCSFHKYRYDEEVSKKYFINLRKEMQTIKDKGFDFSSLYVGGGTTLINEDELLKTLEMAKQLFNIKTVSCESDPSHISPQSLQKFVGIIDRLSVGVQSFDNEILKKVARYEKFGSKDVLIEKLNKAVGILPILSIDLIFNLPFQTEEILREDIRIVKSINPEQFTFYPLMKSPLTRDSIAKTLGVSNEDNEYKFYKIICEEFKDLHKSNAWAFSKQKYDMNDEYVGSNHEYVGIGSGAFSFLNGELLINAFDLNDYGNFINSNTQPVIAKCSFNKKDKIRYLFLTELFDGSINISKFNKANDTFLTKELFMELFLLKLVNAIYEKDGMIYVTEFGSYLCLVLMKEFYTGMDKVRATFKDNNKIKNVKTLRIMEQADAPIQNVANV
ncbi:coproporphyrinogen III oxidase [Campylobacter sputorum subsp. bubulus]|uniref:Coproporphyrinogen III oxidase n=2 Tax=Campylobacter sputorum TaxID=206 RepID=A0A381DIL8_9BACT|nr:oxygen-independent coproporphyrinogen III oxidase [Campylobacter sputorum aubsp. sputorum RM3237]KAB0582692.1 coproporphyrinogen III oxidase family protein [Campylobacter sputorum subsp. sputorum]QEL05766.1 oxygen-independent coproporphyrinogen III oxidase [Campylobacter sputorum subsp. sputorum]SUX08125.1 coproporphyrinogen III oxidase [Campylobacter sputorum subsp. bubulus]SUX10543.1 coproporphyrinogen III oxidase [Campylobacter sputorum subsp. sputorum]